MPYSVLTEPVIPVIMPDGKEKSIGIREVFLEAHHIQDISGSNPLERYALLRLLIAFAMDMLHPKTSYDRMGLLQAGRFDADTLDAYIRECEKDSPRFDLFDKEHPFLQSRYDDLLDNDKIKSVANICPALPQGNNHVFIDHRFENEHCLTPAEAFRALCAFYLFCFPVGAKGYPSSVNNTPPLYTVALGETLYETLICNMLSIAELGNISYGIGLVPWKNICEVTPKKQFADISIIEAYTWMPRRITLVLDDDGLVRRIYLQPGHDFKGNDLWRDPHVPYRKNLNNTYSSVKPEIDRNLWRDVASLTYDKNNNDHIQPGVLAHLSDIYNEDIPVIINIRIMGLVLMNNAKYEIWYEDSLSIPSKILYDDEKALLFREDVQLIESVQSMIFYNVRQYYDKPRAKSDSKAHETASQCRQYFLKEVHDFLFGKDLAEIMNGVPLAVHYEFYSRNIRKMVQSTLRQILQGTGNDTDSLMRQIEAEKWIWMNYHKIMKEREEQYAGS